MGSRIDNLLQIFQSTLRNVNRKEQFCRFLLDHGNVVQDGFVAGMDVQSLYMVLVNNKVTVNSN